MDIDRILMVVTTRCNLTCAYCFQNARQELRMRWEDLKAGVDLALGSGSPRTSIIFSGGEPLLAFELIQRAVEYAESSRSPEKRVQFRLSTNGLLLSGKIADFLQTHKFAVQLSFDGIAEAQRHRGPHTFEMLDRLLDSLRARYPDLWHHNLRITMTLIPATVQHLASSAEYFLRKGVCELSIAPCITHHPGPDGWSMAELDEQVSMISDLSRRHLDLTGKVPALFLRKTQEDVCPGVQVREPCSGLDGRALAVDVDGQVYGCPLFAESCQDVSRRSLMSNLKAVRMGSIRDPAFPEYRARAVQAARRLVPTDWPVRCYSSYGRCCECRHRAGCSICPVSIWSKPNDTDPFRVPDFVCAFNRVVLRHRERFPFTPGTIEDLLPCEGPDPIEPLEAYLRSRR